MDEDKMIDDLVKMLDSGMTEGVGHVNVDYDQDVESKNVQTMGCTDCRGIWRTAVYAEISSVRGIKTYRAFLYKQLFFGAYCL